jgi:hypothetical protein
MTMTELTPEKPLDPDDLSNLGFLASNLIGGEKGKEIAELASRMACSWHIQRGQLTAAHERLETVESALQDAYLNGFHAGRTATLAEEER